LCRAAIFRKLQKCEIPTAFLKNSDALVCGCGWGNEIAAECLSGALAFPGTLVLDADGLNLLSRHPELWQPGENVILTPHPGEAARLLNAFGIADSGRAADNALALADKLKAVILLKGRNTLVASPSGRLSVNASGSPLLATAGSGDVLSGIIGALAAQGVPAFQAAQLGAYIHGIAGELPHRMIIADELPELAGEVIFKLQFNLPV
jgi:NAD(P)H-hydrate epimerase